MWIGSVFNRAIPIAAIYIFINLYFPSIALTSPTLLTLLAIFIKKKIIIIMMKNTVFVIGLVFVIMVSACTPKATDKIEATIEEVPAEAVEEAAEEVVEIVEEEVVEEVAETVEIPSRPLINYPKADKTTINNMKELKIVNPTSQADIDQNLILDYLIENEIKAEKTASGIWYVMTNQGGEEKPDQRSKVKAHYHGTLLNGQKFDSSYDRGQPLDFGLGQVIKGWQEAIQMLGKGGKGTFWIPSELAYGSRATGSIPANSVLKFDIELVDFTVYISPQERIKRESEAIQAHLTEKGISAASTPSGIWYVISNPGEGISPSRNAMVTAHYKGTLLDGTKFDSSYDRNQPFTTPLNRVIQGWQEAIPMLKKGGKGTFYIPSALAYGERGAGTIPPNSILVFEIELLDFNEPKTPVEQAAADDAVIKGYLETRGINALKTASGIYYTIEKEGMGEHPLPTGKVTTHYKGTLIDGTKFDSSYDRGQPLEFGLNQVIRGWQQAIPLLKKGGKGTFYIPSGLAYGPQGAGGVIPPNAVLIFEIELIDFK